MAELSVSILAPAKMVAKTKGGEVMVPGSQGYLTILPGHARLVSELGVGELRVGAGAGTELFFVAGGYLDVAENQVTVLADVVEKVSEINRDRAQEARKRAIGRLDQKNDVDLLRAQAALQRAEQRLALVARSKS